MTHLRNAHVYRIFKTDSNDNVLDPDVWIDVMRIDELVLSEQRGDPTAWNYQDRKYEILWGDNTISMGASPPAPGHRIYEPLVITEPPDPDQDPDDPTLEWVIIPLVQRTHFFFRGSATGDTHQDINWVFRNLPPGNLPSGRSFTLLHVTNNDLNSEIGMPTPNVGDPQPPISPQQTVPWTDYAQAIQDGNVDDNQYVDFACTDRFRIRFPPAPWDKGSVNATYQLVHYCLVNYQTAGGPLGPEDLFNSPPGTNTDGGPDVPGGLYNSDPLQCVVNVNWNGLAVEFGNQNVGPTGPTGPLKTPPAPEPSPLYGQPV